MGLPDFNEAGSRSQRPRPETASPDSPPGVWRRALHREVMAPTGQNAFGAESNAGLAQLWVVGRQEATRIPLLPFAKLVVDQCSDGVHRALLIGAWIFLSISALRRPVDRRCDSNRTLVRCVRGMADSFVDHCSLRRT